MSFYKFIIIFFIINCMIYSGLCIECSCSSETVPKSESVTTSTSKTNEIENIREIGNKINIKLSDGNEIPVIGFGTWQAEGQKLIQAIKDGLKEGFRHIDTAWFFHNEREIAQALQESYKEGIVERKDVYIVYKIWPKNMNYKRTINVIKNALIELNTTYFDLIAIQWPLKNNSDIYKGMETAWDEGLTRSIGVSNFKPKEIDDLMITARVKPVTNHIRIHPGFNQDETIDYCHKNNIAVAGWSPLGTGSLVKDPLLISIGNKYNKSPAQVMIRWQIQRGLSVIPKSTKMSRIKENFDVFNFQMSDEDMKSIHSMPQTNIIDFWG